MSASRVLAAVGLWMSRALAEVQTGEYALRNALTGEYLGMGMTSGVLRVQALEAADQWQLLHASAVQSQGFLLKHVATGSYLSAAASQDTGVLVFGGATPSPQHWVLLDVDNGDGTSFAVWHPEVDRFLSATSASEYPDRSQAGIGMSELPGLQSSHWELIGEATCHTAVEGDACYNDTVWAKDYAISTRPLWYPGLTSASSFEDFQAHLHFCFWRRCPMPCGATVLHRCGLEGRFWEGAAGCADAAPGSRCHGEVQWAMDHGIYLNPEWYPALSERSSFREFQARLWAGEEAGLEEHGCDEPCCHDAKPGERCHEDVAWAKAYGINAPDFQSGYPPYLTNGSSFAEFQAFLHLCYPERCPVPCAETTAMSSAVPGGLECPEARR